MLWRALTLCPFVVGARAWDAAALTAPVRAETAPTG